MTRSRTLAFAGAALLAAGLFAPAAQADWRHRGWGPGWHAPHAGWGWGPGWHVPPARWGGWGWNPAWGHSHRGWGSGAAVGAIVGLGAGVAIGSALAAPPAWHGPRGPVVDPGAAALLSPLPPGW